MGVTNKAGAKMADAFQVLNGYWEEVDDHPLVKIVNNPNPYTSRGQFWSMVPVDLFLAGNSYALKARYRDGLLDGAVGELWRLRPDRIKPVPGDMSKGEPFIKGYNYTIDGQVKFIDARDIIHWKTRNPMNPYEGLPGILSLLPRINIDTYMRTFLSTFFERGGAGAGASLNIKGKMSEQGKKDDIRERFLRMFSGGQFDVLVTAAEDVTYTPFTLNRGLRDALPKEIDAVTEARIAMVLGIPGAILGLLIGYETSSYANQRQAWQTFWDITMTPMLSDFDDVLNLSLTPEFGGIDELIFDLSDIKALQEDEDKYQDRVRKNVASRLWTLEEGRFGTGKGPANPDEHFLLPDGSAVKVSELDSTAPQQQSEPAQLVARAVNLIEARVGRPRVEDDEDARQTYEEAMRIKGTSPSMTWAQVASRVGVVERTLRKYRSVFDDDD